MMEYKKSHCEYLRYQAKQKFQRVRGSMIECGKWALPHRIKYLMSQMPGERNNQHIVDPTHILGLRSCVAGFLEGNTSSTRPWYRTGSNDPDLNLFPRNHAWLDKFTRRTLTALSSSNFYHAAGLFYYEYNTFNTAALYIDEVDGKRLHFHNLEPGSYFPINNAFGEATTLVREFSLNVKALVDRYADKNMSNISSGVKKLYDDCNYTQNIDIVQVVMENKYFNPNHVQAGMNRKWVSITYEVGNNQSGYVQDGAELGLTGMEPTSKDAEKFLEIKTSKRKPFIVARSDASGNFEYGEKGPTLDSLGLIKSLNKKAIGKDQALEHMLRPATQGPAGLRKSYITTAPGHFVPLDATSASQGGIKSIFDINPAIQHVFGDILDMRQQVDKLYFADYLLYLSRNPKTRTATETTAIVQEQQLIIGPNLQSLNYTFNVPLVEFTMDFVLDEDPYLEPPPEDLIGRFLRPEFISVFAQAQRAADLPSIDRFIDRMMGIGQINPKVFDKVNLDKLADLYEDRLYLPAGLNNPQAEVEAMREQALAQQQRQQMMQETLPAVAGAARDIGMQVKQ